MTRVPILRYPIVYLAVHYPPPGIFEGRSNINEQPELICNKKGIVADIYELLKEQKLDYIELSETWDCGAFNRQIAKIAHTFSVACLGNDGWEPLLPTLITGESSHYFHLIGCTSHDSQVCVDPYDLMLDIREFDNVYYVVVFLTLLGFGRLPTYQVVSGRVLDLKAIKSKISKTQNS